MSGNGERRGARVLRIGPDQLRAMRRHAAASYPWECCGILVGVRAGRSARVRRALATANVHRDRAVGFEISPEAILAAADEARAGGGDIVGYYHSHPDGPPRPSVTDRRDAWPSVSYVILSVGPRGDARARSWSCDRSGSGMREEAIVIEDAAGPVSPGVGS